jgi:hypothetical protein
MARPYPKQSTQETAICLPADALEYYAERPHAYTVDMIIPEGEQQPSWQQKEALDGIAKYPKLGISSGKGTGKTTTFAWITSWFLDTRPAPARVIVYGPTEKGIARTLWPEIELWMKKSKVGNHFIWTATKYMHKTDLVNKFATFQASKEEENARGTHAAHLLIIVDEAFGVLNPKIWQEIEGSMTSGEDNKLLWGGNYTVVEGYAHEAFTRNRKFWQPPDGLLLNWNAEESPIANKKHIHQLRVRWGRNHDVYRSLVLGLPPLGSPMAFIRLSDLNEAVTREVVMQGMIEIGVDPARYGDDLTCISIRYGYHFFPLLHCDKSDEVDVYMMVINKVQEMRGQLGYQARIKIKILVTGGLGSGTYDMLKRDKENNIEAVPIYESIIDDPQYHDRMSLMWGEFRDMLPMCHIPDDADLLGELSSREFTVLEKSGKTKIEAKAAFKARTKGPSPDRSDAFVTCASGRAAKKRKWEFYPASCTYAIAGNIKWPELQRNQTPIIPLWVDPSTLATACLLGIWDSQKGILSIIGERVFDGPAPEMILPAVDARIRHLSGGFCGQAAFQWFGNKVFFAANSGDMQLAYSRVGQNVRKNERYNELGGILLIANLISKGKILIDSGLEDLQYQMSEWPVDANDDDPRYILCRALCLIASSLEMTGLLKPQMGSSRPYTDARAKAHQELSQLAMQDRLKELGGRGGYGAGDPHKDDWYHIGMG